MIFKKEFLQKTIGGARGKCYVNQEPTTSSS